MPTPGIPRNDPWYQEEFETFEANPAQLVAEPTRDPLKIFLEREAGTASPASAESEREMLGRGLSLRRLDDGTWELLVSDRRASAKVYTSTDKNELIRFAFSLAEKSGR